MKKLFNSKLFLQVMIASMIATLTTAVIVSAATTIGSNINTGGTLDVTGASTLTGNTAITGTLAVTGKTTLVNASTTLMTVSGQSWLNDNATIAAGKGLVLGSSATAITGSAGMIYYDSTNSVIKLNDGSSWFTVGTSTSGLTLSGNKLQLADLNYYLTIGTTTQQGFSALTLEATSTAAIPLTIVARSSQTANLFQIRNSSSADLLYVNSAGGLFATSTLQVTGATTLYNNLTADTDTFFVNASSNRVGIGTTTPFASLSINNTAGENAFVIGSSTATWLKIDASGLLTVAKGATFSDTLAAGATTITGQLTATTKIGIASTTPFAQLGVGAGGAATSTVSTGKFCMYAGQVNGTMVYITLGDNQPANQPFATSTISCF